jgi:hypothetical protein
MSTRKNALQIAQIYELRYVEFILPTGSINITMNTATSECRQLTYPAKYLGVRRRVNSPSILLVFQDISLASSEHNSSCTRRVPFHPEHALPLPQISRGVAAPVPSASVPINNHTLHQMHTVT